MTYITLDAYCRVDPVWTVPEERREIQALDLDMVTPWVSLILSHLLLYDQTINTQGNLYLLRPRVLQVHQAHLDHLDLLLTSTDTESVETFRVHLTPFFTFVLPLMDGNDHVYFNFRAMTTTPAITQVNSLHISNAVSVKEGLIF